MALERGKLTNVVRVAAATTDVMITCASSKKVYIKSVILHQAGGTISTATAQVYFVPNGGNPTKENKIFDVDVTAGETVLFEPSYPLVLDTTGDTLQVGTGAWFSGGVGLASTHINVMLTGDKEV